MPDWRVCAAHSTHFMEVLLNSIWLVVAIGAIVLWRPEGDRPIPRGRGLSRCFGLIALVCALVLLFPIISLTDDLHDEQAAIEDSSRAVMKARHMVQACLRADRAAFLPAFYSADFSAAALRAFFTSVVPHAPMVYCVALISSHQGRSPPSLT
jgi:hypothetical protein